MAVAAAGGLNRQSGRRERRAVDVQVDLGHVGAVSIEQAVKLHTRNKAAHVLSVVEGELDATSGTGERTGRRPACARTVADPAEGQECSRSGCSPGNLEDRRGACLDPLSDAVLTLDWQNVDGLTGRGFYLCVEGTVRVAGHTVLGAPFHSYDRDGIPGTVGLTEWHGTGCSRHGDHSGSVGDGDGDQVGQRNGIAVVDLFLWSQEQIVELRDSTGKAEAGCRFNLLGVRTAAFGFPAVGPRGLSVRTVFAD